MSPKIDKNWERGRGRAIKKFQAVEVVNNNIFVFYKCKFYYSAVTIIC